MRHKVGGEGCRDMIWQGCQEQSPDALSGKQPSQVAWHARTCWQAEPWLAGEGGWTGEPEFKGAAEGGDRRRKAQEGGGEVSVNHIN